MGKEYTRLETVVTEEWEMWSSGNILVLMFCVAADLFGVKF
jgi:hypothetical protein